MLSGIFGNCSLISSNLILLPPFLLSKRYEIYYFSFDIRVFVCLFQWIITMSQSASASFNFPRAFASLFFTALSVVSNNAATSFTLYPSI